MRNDSPPGVTGEPLERTLVALVVGFANQAPPVDPAAVESYFQTHPWVRHSPYWLTITPAWMGEEDPTGAIARRAAADFAGVQNELRDRLTDGLTAKGRQAVQTALLTRLPPLLERDFPFPRGTERLPLGRLQLSYKRGKFSVGFVPFLTGVQATIDYGLALLFDARRDLSKGLVQCCAPQEAAEEECGRFFWRSARSQRYCSPEDAARAKLEATKGRVRKWREAHPDWYEKAVARREQKKPRAKHKDLRRKANASAGGQKGRGRN